MAFCGRFRSPLFHLEVMQNPVTSFVHLWGSGAASAVILTAMATESMSMTLPSVAQTLVTVLVGFGMVWVAMWSSLPAMVVDRLMMGRVRVKRIARRRE